jgi:hypothetical protein
MYSRPNQKRIGQQSDPIFKYAGVTATWRQYVSASGAVPEAGIGDTQYYRQSTITGHFGFQFLPRFMENVAAPGLIAAGVVQMSTRERIGRQDEIIYNSGTYRVESDPVPAALPGWWVTQIKRASE